jgi:hypothetical protein
MAGCAPAALMVSAPASSNSTAKTAEASNSGWLPSIGPLTVGLRAALRQKLIDHRNPCPGSRVAAHQGLRSPHALLARLQQQRAAPSLMDYQLGGGLDRITPAPGGRNITLPWLSTFKVKLGMYTCNFKIGRG